MTQMVINKKLIKFFGLKIQEIEAQKSKETDLQKIHQLEKNIAQLKRRAKILKSEMKKGLCHGYSVCHGAMDAIGALTWWENILKYAIDWDGTKEGLEKVVVPDPFYSNESVKIGQMLRWLTECLFSSQFGFKLEQIPLLDVDDICQRALLRTKEKKILILDKNNQPYQIKQRNVIAGYFTKEKMLTLFEEKEIEGNICLVGNIPHAIRIGYKKPNWIIYDPDDDHYKKIDLEHPQTIYKTFANKDDFVQEIINIQGESISIEIASFEENKTLSFSAFEEIVKKDPISLLNEDGFALLAVEGFETVLEDHHQESYLLQVLNNASNPHPSPKFIKLISRGITKTYRDCDYSSGLQLVIEDSKDCLPKLIQLATEDQYFREGFIEALNIFNDANESGWDNVANYAPEFLPQLFSFTLQYAPEELSYLLESIIEYAPAYIAQLIRTQGEHYNEFSQAILQKNHRGKTPFEMITRVRGGLENLLNVDKNNHWRICHTILHDERQLHKLLHAIKKSEGAISAKCLVHLYAVANKMVQENISIVFLEIIKNLSIYELRSLADKMSKYHQAYLAQSIWHRKSHWSPLLNAIKEEGAKRFNNWHLNQTDKVEFKSFLSLFLKQKNWVSAFSPSSSSNVQKMRR